jgi:hypothetical protein
MEQRLSKRSLSETFYGVFRKMFFAPFTVLFCRKIKVTVHGDFRFQRYELEFFLMHVINLSENAVGVDRE